MSNADIPGTSDFWLAEARRCADEGNDNYALRRYRKLDDMLTAGAPIPEAWAASRGRFAVVPLFTFDQLSGDARAEAGREIVNTLRANGKFRSMVYAIAADWLSNEGWTDLAELRWEDNGPDPDRLQFSIDESETVLRGKGSNRDFVVWSSTRPWTFLATELRIHTQIVGHWEPGMEIKVADAEGIIPQSQLDPNVKNGAVQAVKDTEARLLDVLRTAGHDAEADVDYLADYATQEGMEFTAKGKLYTE